VTLATFNLGGGEIILVLALVFILFGPRKLPDLARGLGRGISLFGKSIDEESEDAGRSGGGIYGKPAAQAITPDNQVAELYDPRPRSATISSGVRATPASSSSPFR
jgi:sec-independent protein translocase protein TatA